MTRVGAIVLAAGRSSRYRADGGVEETKLVETLEGKPIVRRVVEEAIASRARPIVVVVGHARRAVENAIAGLPAKIAFNPEYASGVASSLRVGLEVIPADVHGALILLGDMPNVDARLIDTLVAAFEAQPTALAAAPRQEGRRGNPVLLSHLLFGAAKRLTSDEGARRLLAALKPSELVEIAAGDSDVVFDVDTPRDLATARRRSKTPSST
jgi:molybdenum cofactor cytidylyltransferase